MDKEFKTTFIPKKRLTKDRSGSPVKSQKKSGLVSLAAGLLFVTALVSTAGVYLYKMSVSANIKSQIDSINLAEKAFEPTVILSLKKLDIRLNAATELLDKHIALSDFFDSLGEATLPGVSFSDFEFTFDEEASEVSMSGEARSYLSIAQQSDLFEKNKYINNHIFSDFQLTEIDSVTFSLSFTLNPELLSYGRKIKNIQVETGIDDGVVIHDQNRDISSGGENVNFNNNANINQ